MRDTAQAQLSPWWTKNRVRRILLVLVPAAMSLVFVAYGITQVALFKVVAWKIEGIHSKAKDLYSKVRQPLDLLDEESAAWTMLSVITCVSQDRIPGRLLRHCVDDSEAADDAIRKLISAGVLDVDEVSEPPEGGSESDSYSIPSLLQDDARQRGVVNEVLAVNAMAKALEDFVWDDSGTWWAMKGLLEHASTLAGVVLDQQAGLCAREAEGDADRRGCLLLASGVLRKLGMYHLRIGSFSLSESFLDGSLEVLRKYGADDASVGRAMVDLGELYVDREKLQEARTVLQEALALLRADAGDTPTLDISNCLWNLGNAKYLLLDKKEAEVLFSEALSMKRNVYGVDAQNPNIAETLRTLGVVKYHRRELDGAESLFSEALSIYRQVYGADVQHAIVAEALQNLGAVKYHRQDLDGAEESFSDALSMMRKVHGTDAQRSDIANTMENLGAAKWSRHELNYGEALYSEALSIYRQVYGTDAQRSDIATMLNKLGLMKRGKEDLDGAEVLHRQALSMKRQVFGANAQDINIAGTLQSLGDITLIRGDLDEARRLFEEALESYQLVYGATSQHPSITYCAKKLELIASYRGDGENGNRSLSWSRNVRQGLQRTNLGINTTAIKEESDNAKTGFRLHRWLSQKRAVLKTTPRMSDQKDRLSRQDIELLS